MLGYILLFVGLFVCRYGLIGAKRQIIGAMVVITLFSALRYGIGYDYYTYLDAVSTANIDGFEASRFEFVPRQIAIFSANTNPYLFFVITSVFISVFTCVSILRAEDKMRWPAFVFYLCFPLCYMYGLATVRQAMATSVILCAITVFNGRRLWQIALITLAILCHITSIVAIIILLPLEKLKRWHLLAIFVLSFFSGELLPVFVSSFDSLLSDFAFFVKFTTHMDNASTANDMQKIRFLIYIIAFICILCYNSHVFPKLEKEKFKYFISLVCIGASFFALFWNIDGSMSKRFCMFFFSSAMFVLPYIIFNYYKISRAVYYVSLFILLLLLIAIGANDHSRDGDTINTSATYPYRSYIFE